MACTACSAAVEEGSRFCAKCGAAQVAGATAAPRPPGPPLRAPEEPGLAGRMIPTRNPPALIGYYLAVFSIIPFLGAPLAPAALILGMIGLRRIRRDPALPGKVHAWVGIVVGGLVTAAYGAGIVYAVLGRVR